MLHTRFRRTVARPSNPEPRTAALPRPVSATASTSGRVAKVAMRRDRATQRSYRTTGALLLRVLGTTQNVSMSQDPLIVGAVPPEEKEKTPSSTVLLRLGFCFEKLLENSLREGKTFFFKGDHDILRMPLGIQFHKPQNLSSSAALTSVAIIPGVVLIAEGWRRRFPDVSPTLVELAFVLVCPRPRVLSKVNR